MLSALQKLESVGTGSILQAEIHSFICRPTDSSRVCLSRHIFSRQTTEQGAKLLTNPDLFLFHHQNVGDMRYFSQELYLNFLILGLVSAEQINRQLFSRIQFFRRRGIDQLAWIRSWLSVNIFSANILCRGKSVTDSATQRLMACEILFSPADYSRVTHSLSGWMICIHCLFLSSIDVVWCTQIVVNFVEGRTNKTFGGQNLPVFFWFSVVFVEAGCMWNWKGAFCLCGYMCLLKGSDIVVLLFPE